jgi:hypothetical protein
MPKIVRECILFSIVLSMSCMRYLTHDRSKAIVPGVDIDQTLFVAQSELRRGSGGAVLSLWVIRDQELTPQQASRISDLYFAYADSFPRSFSQWHLSWAIGNMFRQGNAEVQGVLRRAYTDASARARTLGGLANRFVNGDTLWMGDAHIGGRRYAQKHIVVPGNQRYLQSFEQYRGRK